MRDDLFMPEVSTCEPSLQPPWDPTRDVDLSAPPQVNAHPVVHAIHAVAESTPIGTLFYPGDALDEVERRGLVPADRDERRAFMGRLWSELHPSFPVGSRGRLGEAPRTLAAMRRRLGYRLDEPLFLVIVRRR